MNIEVFLQIFLWFKFCTSVQICIYLPTFVLIYTLCNSAVPLNAIFELYVFRVTCASIWLQRWRPSYRSRYNYIEFSGGSRPMFSSMCYKQHLSANIRHIPEFSTATRYGPLGDHPDTVHPGHIFLMHTMPMY